MVLFDNLMALTVKSAGTISRNVDYNLVQCRVAFSDGYQSDFNGCAHSARMTRMR
jgi:hypothetical protein